LPPNHNCINLDRWKRKPRPYDSTIKYGRKPQKITKNYGKKILNTVKDIVLAFIIIVITIILFLIIVNPSSYTPTSAPASTPISAAVSAPVPIPVSAPVVDITTLEQQIHYLVNLQRQNQGLLSLQWDASLATIARKHSEDMAKNNYFSHYNLQGLDPTARGSEAEYSCYKNYGSYYTTGIAENIFQTSQTTTYNGIMVHDVIPMEEIAQSTVNGWMNSPGHRQNILTSTYDREGIGVAIASDNKVYVTEDFC
jgi:uncharacterized protein YkwD